MPHTKQSRKRARQAETRRQHNMARRSMIRTCLKKVVRALAQRDRAQAESAYTEASSILDRMARKGIIHKRKAARHKSRLNDRLRTLSTEKTGESR